MTAGLIRSTSPARPDHVVLERSRSTGDDVTRVVALARAAAREWAALPAVSRSTSLAAAGEALSAERSRIAHLITSEVGKPAVEARAEVDRAVGLLLYYAQQVLDPDGQTYPSPDGRSLLYSRTRPHGVAGLITPWNFPVAIPTWKLAPALAYGNGVVLKPSSEAPACAAQLVSILGPHLPPGLLGAVYGGADVATRLIEEADVLSFTGSEMVGRSVGAAAFKRLVPFQGELGGHNASIVLPDANVIRSAQMVAGAAMAFAGQKCTATSRVIVVGRNDGFVDALISAVANLPVGDPDDDSVIVGPVINQLSKSEIMDAISRAEHDGGEVVAAPTPDATGLYVAPTIVLNLQADHHLNQEEVFGPVISVLAASSPDEAVELERCTRFGLVTSVFTRDLDRALSLSRSLESGQVRVNAPTTGVDFFAPFGGHRASGVGPKEQGKAAREFFTWTQTTTVAPHSR
jgi:alpha-ketoglutaric semialdehyde dehydrogenase